MNLPPLPSHVAYYTAQQMQEYAQAAIDSYIASTKKHIPLNLLPKRMSLMSARNTPVRFDGLHVADYQKKQAEEVLRLNDIYYVDVVFFTFPDAEVKLQGIDRWFNLNMFAKVE